jgi:hypothetical protein
MEPLSQATTPSHVVMKETIPLINKPSRGVLSGYFGLKFSKIIFCSMMA